MAGRAAVLAWEETKQANPCVPSDHIGIYEYGGLSYDLVAAPSGAAFDACSKLVTIVLKQDADCGAPAVSPPHPPQLFLKLQCRIVSPASLTAEQHQGSAYHCEVMTSVRKDREGGPALSAEQACSGMQGFPSGYTWW